MNQFYRDMNLERESERWSTWTTHRNEINLLINRSLMGIQGADKAIILGAGNCDDLDLKYLCFLFNKICLVDLDGATLNEAILSLQDQVVKEKLQVLGNIDLTKLDQIHFFERIIVMLEQKVSFNDICAFFDRCWRKTRRLWGIVGVGRFF